MLHSAIELSDTNEDTLGWPSLSQGPGPGLPIRFGYVMCTLPRIETTYLLSH
jgi:hypothetical protein